MRAWLVTAVLLAACGPAHREPPADRPRSEGPVVVGTVSPEGRVEADTVSSGAPDTDRVDRETVVTGAIAPDPNAPAGEARATEPSVRGETAPGPASGPWVVQVFASRDEPTALEVAREVEDEAGEPARAVQGGGWYKVRAGGYADRSDAEALRIRLATKWSDAFVLRVP